MGHPTRPPLAAVLTLALAAPAAAQDASQGAPPTVQEAERFMENAEATLDALGLKDARASWVAANFITDDTQALAADAETSYAMAVQRLAIDARRFAGLDLAPVLARKFELLRLALSAPPPGDPAKAKEMTELKVGMNGDYGSGSYCLKGGEEATSAEHAGECLQITALGKIMSQSRDPDELLEVWKGWRTISPPMRGRYARFVELSNEGARELGFEDTGAMWRSNYEMAPDAFEAETERLWQQVRPLYVALHAYVRTRLAQAYGTDLVPPDGLIPAHLLGNMWAQDWTGIYPLAAPADAGETVDITGLLRAKGTDARDMVRYGEGFFTSLGFAPLPDSFWERSLFTKPRDRDVVCHASAWSIDGRDDIRIKMCINIDGEDFSTIHHELGHNFYQRAYEDQPYMFKGGANGGFHEAIGDAIALSITPDYLVRVGLLDEADEPGPEADIGLLLQRALDKVAFLPFGLLIDKWRWQVFSGDVGPDGYNEVWWELRNRYQGVAAPVARSEADFDPGAKYHIPANVSYTRYFIADVLQFQFHRALCRAAGYEGPLHRCSIYQSEEAGKKLAAMLEKGQSEPWQDALFALTGQREMDATAILDYFAPLKAWLDEQNRGHAVGWTTETASTQD